MPADPQYEKIHPLTKDTEVYGCKNKPRIPTGELTSTGEVYVFSSSCRHNESHNDPKCVGCQDVGQGKSYSDSLEILNSGLAFEDLVILENVRRGFWSGDSEYKEKLDKLVVQKFLQILQYEPKERHVRKYYLTEKGNKVFECFINSDLLHEWAKDHIDFREWTKG